MSVFIVSHVWNRIMTRTVTRTTTRTRTSTVLGRPLGLTESRPWASQSSPIRASPRKKAHAKLADLPRYRGRIVEAIKANPGRKSEWPSGELSRSYALTVHHKALKKYCDEHNIWSIRPDALTVKWRLCKPTPCEKKYGFRSQYLQAKRLGRSGHDGYPDEDDILYLATTTGTPFEVAQDDVAYKLHYGTPHISAIRAPRPPWAPVGGGA